MTVLAITTTITGVEEVEVEEGMTVVVIVIDTAVVVVVDWCRGMGPLVPSCTTTTMLLPHCSCATCLQT